MTKQDLINFLQALTTPNVVEKTSQANGKYFKVNETEFEADAEKLVIEERKKFPETKNNEIYIEENNAIKLNLSFGYVTVKNNDLKLFKPGRNYFFDTVKQINNAEDISNLKKEITVETITHKLTNRFPDSSTRLVGVYAMAAKITRLDFPIGAPINLPQYILNSTSIISLQNVDNNLCFWYCVAVADEECRKDRASRKAKELFKNFYGTKKRVTDYVGFDYVNELDRYENKLSSIFLCQRCGKKFGDNANLDRHYETCALTQEDVFCKYPSLWKKDRNLIVELADTYDVDVDFKYDYMITFDMESRMQKMNDKVSDKLTYTMKHIPTSVAIATNVPGFEDDKFILNEDPNELVKEMFKWFDDVASKASQLMLEKMQPLLCRLESNDRLKSKVQRYCEVIPIVGFNKIMKRRELDKIDPMVIKEGNRYKTIKTGQFQFLDQMSYVAAGTKLESFIKAYVNVQKGWFPYEWFDSYDKLNYLTLNLTIEDFNSSLNGSMAQENFEDLMKICVDKNLVTVRDLLEWYNILDLDMYKDACSLPGLSENILYQFQISGFEEYLKEKPKKIEHYTPISETQINKRIDGYRQQDEKAKRPPCNLTVNCVREILENGNHSCIYCWLELGSDTWSLDRIDNALPHAKSNCVASCIKCNKARSDKMFKEFYRHKAMLRFEKDHPMIWLFGEENKNAFYKLKKNITGGASIVFHRYHEVNKTEITRAHYNGTEWTYPEKGKAVKKIVGFDANALYLHSLGEEMPCGKLYFKESNNWKVDIEVPKDKWNYFSEMCPIFVNKEYDETICGDYTLNLLESLERKPTKSRKLRWMLEHGCVVTKLYGYIEAKRRRIFKGFMDWVSDERRKGDVDSKYAIISEALLKFETDCAIFRTEWVEKRNSFWGVSAEPDEPPLAEVARKC
ncbi:Protein CBG10425 [Caenorhabditis briggsae]|uniref:Protein CBG10425 n=1 Tax=Caenorhabditis briggsae TaxID=6238 RepID=A8XB66_CAEBR|nr:Protein CBG10425 [Caenorhabditis briggsae]CAP29846.1 Protein CBG10425 [Caenorhabditis briggsae]